MSHVCICGYIGHTRSKYGGYSRAYKHLKWENFSQQQQFVNDVVVQLQQEKGRSIHGTRRETEREIAITHIIINNSITERGMRSMCMYTYTCMYTQK